MKRASYIQNLIKKGENQFQDFKFTINDSKKIARSLVAFANTSGGRLLIGVKDNGKVAGVRTEEEFHMVEAAAQLYCKPEILFKRKDWIVERKKVLEIIIPESKIKPHLTQTEKGKWLAFIRVEDENILANIVLMRVWEKQKSNKGIRIQYTEAENYLLSYLNQNNCISLKQFYKQANISRYRAINILSNFIVLELLEPFLKENDIFYKSPSKMVV
ncbi:MAG: ATP-binding protein [Bacteroidota bacterium]